MNSAYEYYVGGAMPLGEPTYVRRQADQDLFNGLTERRFCYVLNTRQMGKSSLRVQVMETLRARGVACAAMDLSIIGSKSSTWEQWYAGVIRSLVNSFGLTHEFNLRDWWKERDFLTPPQRFSEFLEEVLLKKIPSPTQIVIFVDEIDSVLSLDFKADDFFVVIRACYNKRADNTELNRLTFSLLGVADPSDLIQDKTRTPFNIGQAIQLKGFTAREAQPLVPGLADKFSDPKAAMLAILEWTNGQPFLTHKICKLIQEEPAEQVPAGQEAAWVSNLVQSKVIDNWESQDNPEHLKTIVNRILQSPGQRTALMIGLRTARMIGIYQQIVQRGHVEYDGSQEQIELRLSGLVIEDNEQLKVHNRIYKMIFSQQWVDKVLASLRPYSEALLAWFASGRTDESRLLKGKALEEAQEWAAGKSLSVEDYQFLAASQNTETRGVQRALEAAEEARQAAEEAQQMESEARKNLQEVLEAEKEAKTKLQDVLTATEEANNSLESARTEAEKKSAEARAKYSKSIKAIIAAIIVIILAVIAAIFATRKAVSAGQQAIAAEMARVEAQNESEQALQIANEAKQRADEQVARAQVAEARAHVAEARAQEAAAGAGAAEAKRRDAESKASEEQRRSRELLRSITQQEEELRQQILTEEKNRPPKVGVANQPPGAVEGNNNSMEFTVSTKVLEAFQIRAQRAKESYHKVRKKKQ